MICEAFGCTPSAAAREMEADPDTVIWILKLRHYKQAFHEYERLEKTQRTKNTDLSADYERLFRSPMGRLVREFDFELVGREQMRRHKERNQHRQRLQRDTQQPEPAPS